MPALFQQLGVDWKLLSAQGVNFLIVLLALTFLVYRPLLKIMAERRKKIEFGLAGAEEAEKRLTEIEKIKEKSLSETKMTALGIIKSAEKEAKLKTEEISKEAKRKADLILKEAGEVAEQKKIEELKTLAGEARELIKEAIVKTVELEPERVDEKLIERALGALKEKIS